jgi:hypothetical protein
MLKNVFVLCFADGEPQDRYYADTTQGRMELWESLKLFVENDIIHLDNDFDHHIHIMFGTPEKCNDHMANCIIDRIEVRDKQ